MKTLVVWLKKNWLTVIKIAVLAVSLWVLFNELVIDKSWKGFQAIRLFRLLEEPLLWIVFALLFANWGLEALKWKLLLSRFEEVTYRTAVKSVFTGVFISLFVNILMPNRVGEFAGRIIYTKIHKVKAALISGIGSFAQFAATVLFGCTAYLVFWNWFEYDNWEQYSAYLLIVAVVFFAAIIPLLYFNINVFSWVLSKPRFLRRFKKITSVFYFYHNKDLLKIFGLSALRYAIFCFQFIFLLWTCDLPVTTVQGIVVIPVIFLIQTLVPTNSLSDLGVRGAASIHFLNYFTDNDAGILTAAYLLWTINILLPGIAGALFFAVFKYREYGNGNNA